MMEMKKLLLFVTIVVVIISGCAAKDTPKNQSSNQEMDHSTMNHSNMDHSSSDTLPKNMKNKNNPTYKVGNKVMVKESHMEGMKGAIATVTGAYETTAYIVSYKPTTGGEMVKDHKWVVQEEIQNATAKPFPQGAKVILEADHMKGMKGANAVIESSYQTTVYTVDYTPTTGGEMVKNHKWMTENELSLP
jgi:uncharacterized protein involved in copper resistance